jgi:hypothetical protein
MLTDPHEVEIIASAEQKNVRDPKRSRKPFDHIFSDFCLGERVRGQRLLDLGPGQFDFAAVALSHGAMEVWGIDRDPAVIALGRYKGLPVIEGELRELAMLPLQRGEFHGVFCKYSIDAFWFERADLQRAHIAALADLLRPDGWAWIAPWNGARIAMGLAPSQRVEALCVQREAFVAVGFEVFELSEDLTIRYGVHGLTANRPLFTRNVTAPPGLAG